MAYGIICQEEMHEAFIRLEKPHCRSGLEVSGELTWPGLASVGQWIMIAIIMRWFFPIGVFHRKIIVSFVVACFLLFPSHILIIMFV